MVLLQNEILSVEISPLGAELQSLRSLHDGSEWLWQGDKTWWTGRAPLLFPIVGQCPEGEVEIEGRHYAMRSHGFARHSVFTLADHEPHRARLCLMANEETRAAYPFDFRLTVEYRLEGACLITDVCIENLDQREMPFQFGFHPAFVLPLPRAEGQPHEVRFAEAQPQKMRRLSGGLMHPEVLPSPLKDGKIVVDPKDYMADAMVFPDLGAQRVIYQGGPSAVQMEVEGLPDFALWQKPDAPFLCLEPWHGMAPYPHQGKSLAARPNAILLAQGQEHRFAMTLSLLHPD